MSNVVWSAHEGWHDGAPVKVGIDSAGRLTSTPEACQWFAMCTNPATTTMPHPVLGDVPICDRCKRKAESQ